jgi:hypothetical protein
MPAVMLVFALAGGMLLALAVILREMAVSRDRAAANQSVEELRRTVDVLRGHVQRTSDEVFVLRATLEERNLVNEHELERNRKRLVEEPRRQARERQQIVSNENVSPTQVVIDEGESIH